MGGAILGALAVLGADQLGDLGVHQPLHEPPERLAQEVGVVLLEQVADDLIGRHALPLGHRGAPLVEPSAVAQSRLRKGAARSHKWGPERLSRAASRGAVAA